MVTVRVFLECASATNKPGGLFDSFFALDEAALARGAHITMACRRAAVLGFNGPYRVIEVRRLDQPRISVEEVCAQLNELGAMLADRSVSPPANHQASRPRATTQVQAQPAPAGRSRVRAVRR